MAKEKISNEQLFKENKLDELYLNVIGLMHYKGNLYQKIDDDEKESIYNMAFAEAVRRYDLSKEVKFSTFLCLILLGHLNKFVKRDREFRYSHLRISLDASYDDEHESYNLSNIIESTTYSNPEEHVICKDILDNIDNILDSKTAKCFKLYLSDINQTDIGKELGISQVQVSRLIKKGRIILKGYYNGTENIKPKIEQNNNTQNQKLEEKVIEIEACKRKTIHRINKKKTKEGGKKMATKKEQCFSLLDEGYSSSEIVKALAISKNTVTAYKQMWFNARNHVQKEEASSELMQQDTVQDVIEAPKDLPQDIPVVLDDEFNIVKSPDIDTSINPEIDTQKHYLELLYDNKTYRGKFGIYKISNGTSIDIVLDNPFATLTLEEFDIFNQEINELKQIIGQ